jgi:hypothetical protein
MVSSRSHTDLEKTFSKILGHECDNGTMKTSNIVLAEVSSFEAAVCDNLKK